MTHTPGNLVGSLQYSARRTPDNNRTLWFRHRPDYFDNNWTIPTSAGLFRQRSDNSKNLIGKIGMLETILFLPSYVFQFPPVFIIYQKHDFPQISFPIVLPFLLRPTTSEQNIIYNTIYIRKTHTFSI